MTRLPSILLAPHHDNDDNGENVKNKECGNDDCEKKRKGGDMRTGHFLIR